MSNETCSKCGKSVPPILGPPPKDRDVWWRNAVMMRRVETVSYVLRLSRHKRQWLPADPRDQVSSYFTDLVLCDSCSADVFLFAQGGTP